MGGLVGWWMDEITFIGVSRGKEGTERSLVALETKGDPDFMETHHHPKFERPCDREGRRGKYKQGQHQIMPFQSWQITKAHFYIIYHPPHPCRNEYYVNSHIYIYSPFIMSECLCLSIWHPDLTF